jgi:uncharacterized membrane protein YeaQ/YmgE (transglycosylase-associated protein family)
MKKIILPIILGCTAGTLTYWAFDSFEPQKPIYFVNAFLKALIPIVVVVIVLSKWNK